jgi:hypothetical protein
MRIPDCSSKTWLWECYFWFNSYIVFFDPVYSSSFRQISTLKPNLVMKFDELSDIFLIIQVQVAILHQNPSMETGKVIDWMSKNAWNRMKFILGNSKKSRTKFSRPFPIPPKCKFPESACLKTILVPISNFYPQRLPRNPLVKWACFAYFSHSQL